MSELSNANIDPAIAEGLQQLKHLSIRDVDSLKKRIEKELGSNLQRLSDEHADMDSPLVINGFPRDDIDVLQVRLIRRNIHMLRNDLRKVLDRSHELINQHFKELQAKTRQETHVAADVEYRIPFAKITEVVPASPAAEAGFQLNDELVLLGHIHVGNHMKLTNLQNTVIQNEDRQLPVKILRDGHIIQSTLTPTRKWAGRGLLGCRLVEL
ncbi:hypothetical protein ZYGR_0AI02250 [Zygosaccharomyces rouxii]|uniref:Probable 26S proteasome regulatory subunit p27 n=1 Tax=Zygosaccharomyces rouxii TaxID=4956 RepID=A0A1Q3ABN2_ZYGRO|nr:hypothetical protein ZYGR_0AI02250 [Zygosaccharomyces rouxii]